jgi:hypothetical protein
MWVVIILSAFFFVENNLIRITMMAIAAIVSNYIIKLPTYISLDEGSAS